MDINAVWSGVVGNQILFELTDSTNRTFKNLLDENSFLWVDHLIIALFKLSVDLNVFDVQASQVMEDIIVWPG